MAILHFDKQELTNLEYSLDREVLSCNRAGGYMSTTLVCCNTRKYHGLMVCPNESQRDQLYVLLSSLDETLIQHDQQFNLGIHQYQGIFEPRGHKYIVDFSYTPTPTVTYRVGGMLLRKELLWVHSSEQIFVRYTLLEAHSPTVLRLRPLLAFRNRHELSVCNIGADLRSVALAGGGVKCRVYDGFPYLNMQVGGSGVSSDSSDSSLVKFVAAPDWYMGIYYRAEDERGYECYEDLPTPGYFEMELEVGRSVIFSASTGESLDVDSFADSFEQEIARRSEKVDFMSVLQHSARQFLIRRSGADSLMAGYPWYNSRSRETFISLAGCTLVQGLGVWCENILDHHLTRLRGGVFGEHLAADTALWFFHTLSELERYSSARAVWEKYGGAMKQILECYRLGDTPGGVIRMDDNGLVWASQDGVPLTWMNVVVDGHPVTRRGGYAVEVNALWYNAVSYTLKLARVAQDTEFIEHWGEMPQLIADSFNRTFVLEGGRYLSDYVWDGRQCYFIRPNQLLACSLEFSPLDDAQQWGVLETVRVHLLTAGGGVRTLSPRNPLFKGHYGGDAVERDMALHQGSAVVWMLEHYVRANFKLRGAAFVATAAELLRDFTHEFSSYCIGSVAEVHDGNPPYQAGGAISYAPSVGALLSIAQMIRFYGGDEYIDQM